MSAEIDAVFLGIADTPSISPHKATLTEFLGNHSLEDPVSEFRNLTNRILVDVKKFSADEGLGLKVALQRLANVIQHGTWANTHEKHHVDQIVHICSEVKSELELYQSALHPVILNVLDRMQ